jgi:uncharacterized protein (DUF4415 family)
LLIKDLIMNKDFTPGWEEQAPVAASGGNMPAAQAATVGQKQIVTIRLDVDTLSWFKSAGPGYQTRINQILRDYMDAQKAKGLEK